MTKKKPKKHHVKTRLQKSRKVISKGSKRRRRKPSPVNSKAKNPIRKKSSKLVSKTRKSIKRSPKRKRKSVKNLRVSNKVQKVSRVKKQQRGTKKVHKRAPAKQVRKVRKLVTRVRKPQAYTPFNDDKGEKKLYRIELRQFKTFKEKRSYINRFNFWPMITEAENLFEDRFPFGFMVIIQTKYNGDELDMASKLSDIEAAIDDPNVRQSVLESMDKFRVFKIEHPQIDTNQKNYNELFKPNNIKAIIIRFLYRTFNNASS